MAPTLTIAWDVDDVLNSLTGEWFERAWRPAHPGCGLGYDQLQANPPHELLGVELRQYLDSLDAFREAHYSGLAPSPMLLDWFRRYGDRYHHLALTAVPLGAARRSAKWVVQHFGRWIRTFHFIPSHREGERLPVYDGSKGEYLSRMEDAAMLVDDSEQNVQGALDRGVAAMLFPAPWNGARDRQPADLLSDLRQQLKDNGVTE